MIFYKQGTQVIYWENKVVCNSCGIELDLEHNEIEQFQRETFHKFDIEFGYGSPRDGQKLSFDLCESCIEKIIQNLVIAPKITGWAEEYRKFVENKDNV